MEDPKKMICTMGLLMLAPLLAAQSSQTLYKCVGSKGSVT